VSERRHTGEEFCSC